MKNSSFLREIIPLVELYYDVNEETDWIRQTVAEEDIDHVRLMRTVYLISKIASFHASKLCKIGVDFRNLWKRIEKEIAMT